MIDTERMMCYICGVRNKQKLTKNEYGNVYHRITDIALSLLRESGQSGAPFGGKRQEIISKGGFTSTELLIGLFSCW